MRVGVGRRGYRVNVLPWVAIFVTVCAGLAVLWEDFRRLRFKSKVRHLHREVAMHLVDAASSFDRVA